MTCCGLGILKRSTPAALPTNLREEMKLSPFLGAGKASEESRIGLLGFVELALTALIERSYVWAKLGTAYGSI